MKKSKIVLIAMVFTMAIGGAFASQSSKTTVFNYTDTAGCPNVPVQCSSTTGPLCAHIFLDTDCSIQAHMP